MPLFTYKANTSHRKKMLHFDNSLHVFKTVQQAKSVVKQLPIAVTQHN